MVIKNIILLIMIGSVMLSFVACSNEHPVQTKEVVSKVYDPCQMLEIKDIEAIFPESNIKITTHDTKSVNPLGMRRCFWDAGDDMKFVQLSISSDAESSAMNAEKQFENNKAFFKDAKAISSLGYDAYYGGSGLKAGAGLHVLVRNKGILLHVSVGLGVGNSDAQKHIEIETSLAKKVIDLL